MKPVLTWPGNRQRLADSIRNGFPNRVRHYYEPMLGGGGVFLATENMASISILGDINPWLMSCYHAIRDHCEQVISILESLAPHREVYERIKGIHPDYLDSNYRAAHLIYLNQMAFGHVFRVNKSGYFNVPWGDYPKLGYDADTIRGFSRRLQGCLLAQDDFSSSIKSECQPGDFVYFDPPSPERRVFGYSGASSPATGEFSTHDYYRMLDICILLSDRGVLWALSDDNTSFVRMLFSDFKITVISRDPLDQEIKHLLITNYDTKNGLVNYGADAVDCRDSCKSTTSPAITARGGGSAT